MYEQASLPWDQILSYFIWILGASMILSSVSYYWIISRFEKTNETSISRLLPIKILIVGGMVLVFLGLSLSVHRIWITAIFGAACVLSAYYLIRLAKIRKSASKDREA